MNHVKKNLIKGIICSAVIFTGCKTPALVQTPQVKTAPAAYSFSSTDTVSSGAVQWRSFFTDKYLVSLIDTALKNNQELSITLQEIEIAKNEILMRKGQLLPKVEAGGGMGVEKVGRYTSQGAGDASAEITPGKIVPEYLGDYHLGASASWEVDIWKKLRNSKQAAVTRYLSTIEGRNFIITNLIS
jgi:outer membrane protein, multidrug efflux system